MRKNKKLLGSDLKDSGLEKLIPSDKQELDGLVLYVMESPVNLKINKIIIAAPKGVDIYEGVYKRTQIQQLVFGVRPNHPAILSKIQRKDINYKHLVKLADAEWLDPHDTYMIYGRLMYGASGVVVTSDRAFFQGNYPLAKKNSPYDYNIIPETTQRPLTDF